MSESPKFDAGKAPVHLVVPEFILGIARILAFGAKKYSAWSWTAGKDWSRDYSAMMRHLLMFWAGQDLDPETGESHLLHLACDNMFLFISWLKGLGKDDRHKFPPDVLDRMNAALKAVEAETTAEEKKPKAPRNMPTSDNIYVHPAQWLLGRCIWCERPRAAGEEYFCTRRCAEAAGRVAGRAEAIVAACEYAKANGVEA